MTSQDSSNSNSNSSGSGNAAAVTAKHPNQPSSTNIGHAAATSSERRLSRPAALSVATEGSRRTPSPSPHSAQPCLHTNKPEFISTHMQRCEACQLKYARKAEAAANHVPYHRRTPSHRQHSHPSRPLSAEGIRPKTARGSTVPPPSASIAATQRGLSPVPLNIPTRRLSSGGPIGMGRTLGIASSSGRSTPRSLTGSGVASTSASAGPTSRHRATPANHSTLPPIPPLSAASLFSPSDKSPDAEAFPGSPTPAIFVTDGDHVDDLTGQPPNAPPSPDYAKQGPLLPDHKPAGLDLSSGLDEGPSSSRKPAPSKRLQGKKIANSRPYESPNGSEAGGSLSEMAGYINDPLSDSLQQALLQNIDSLQTQLREKDDEIYNLRRKLTLRSPRVLSPSPESRDDERDSNCRGPRIPGSPDCGELRAQRLLEVMARFDLFKREVEDNMQYLRGLPYPIVPESGVSPKLGSRVVSTARTPYRRRTNAAELAMDSFARPDDANRRVTLGDGEVRSLSSNDDPFGSQSSKGAATPRRTSANFASGGGILIDPKLGDDLGPAASAECGDWSEVIAKFALAISHGETILSQARHLQLKLSEKEEDAERMRAAMEEVNKRQEIEIKRLKRANEQQQGLSSDIYDLHGEKQRLEQLLDEQKANLTKAMSETNRLQRQLSQAQVQIEQFEDKCDGLTAELTKAKARYEYDTANLRRTVGQLQREKSEVMAKNQELRSELKGKLQRAGFKGDIDEYLTKGAKDRGDEQDEDSFVGEVAALEHEGSPRQMAGKKGPRSAADLERQVRALEQSNTNMRRQLERSRAALHREKSEKLELRNMLTETQEQVEELRSNAGIGGVMLGEDLGSAISNDIVTDIRTPRSKKPLAFTFSPRKLPRKHILRVRTSSLNDVDEFSPRSSAPPSERKRRALTTIKDDDDGGDDNDDNDNISGFRAANDDYNDGDSTDDVFATPATHLQKFSEKSERRHLAESDNEWDTDPEDAKENFEDEDSVAIRRHQRRMQKLRSMYMTPRVRKPTRSPRHPWATAAATVAGPRVATSGKDPWPAMPDSGEVVDVTPRIRVHSTVSEFPSPSPSSGLFGGSLASELLATGRTSPTVQRPREDGAPTVPGFSSLATEFGQLSNAFETGATAATKPAMVLFRELGKQNATVVAAAETRSEAIQTALPLDLPLHCDCCTKSRQAPPRSVPQDAVESFAQTESFSVYVDQGAETEAEVAVSEVSVSAAPTYVNAGSQAMAVEHLEKQAVAMPALAYRATSTDPPPRTLEAGAATEPTYPSDVCVGTWGMATNEASVSVGLVAHANQGTQTDMLPSTKEQAAHTTVVQCTNTAVLTEPIYMRSEREVLLSWLIPLLGGLGLAESNIKALRVLDDPKTMSEMVASQVQPRRVYETADKCLLAIPEELCADDSAPSTPALNTTITTTDSFVSTDNVKLADAVFRVATIPSETRPELVEAFATTDVPPTMDQAVSACVSTSTSSASVSALPNTTDNSSATLEPLLSNLGVATDPTVTADFEVDVQQKTANAVVGTEYGLYSRDASMSTDAYVALEKYVATEPVDIRAPTKSSEIGVDTSDLLPAAAEGGLKLGRAALSITTTGKVPAMLHLPDADKDSDNDRAAESGRKVEAGPPAPQPAHGKHPTVQSRDAETTRHVMEERGVQSDVVAIHNQSSQTEDEAQRRPATWVSPAIPAKVINLPHELATDGEGATYLVCDSCKGRRIVEIPIREPAQPNGELAVGLAAHRHQATTHAGPEHVALSTADSCVQTESVGEAEKESATLPPVSVVQAHHLPPSTLGSATVHQSPSLMARLSSSNVQGSAQQMPALKDDGVHLPFRMHKRLPSPTKIRSSSVTASENPANLARFHEVASSDRSVADLTATSGTLAAPPAIVRLQSDEEESQAGLAGERESGSGVDVSSSRPIVAASPHSHGLVSEGEDDDYDSDEEGFTSAEVQRVSHEPGSVDVARAGSSRKDAMNRQSIAARTLGPNVRQPDPMIIQAIARTMVGSFMWKFKSSPRLGTVAAKERRHMRYFWIHPYAKMLNWNRYPPSGSTSLSTRMKAQGSRSVFIRNIRIVADHQTTHVSDAPSYSIIVQTNSREIKIKATNQYDHDQWYIALSYLQNRPVVTSHGYVGQDVPRFSTTSSQVDTNDGFSQHTGQRTELSDTSAYGGSPARQGRHPVPSVAPRTAGRRPASSELPPPHPQIVLGRTSSSGKQRQANPLTMGRLSNHSGELSSAAPSPGRYLNIPTPADGTPTRPAATLQEHSRNASNGSSVSFSATPPQHSHHRRIIFRRSLFSHGSSGGEIGSIRSQSQSRLGFERDSEALDDIMQGALPNPNHGYSTSDNNSLQQQQQQYHHHRESSDKTAAASHSIRRALSGPVIKALSTIRDSASLRSTTSVSGENVRLQSGEWSDPACKQSEDREVALLSDNDGEPTAVFTTMPPQKKSWLWWFG